MLLASASWAQEILYVHDELRLGVRPSADSRSTPLEVVTTGARLEVLSRSGNFVRVRTPRGNEGWVNAAYLSDEKPARLLLDELQQARAQLEDRLAEEQGRVLVGNERLSELGERIERLHSQLQEAQQHNLELRAQLQQEESAWGWLLQPLMGILLFLFGIFLGVKWYRHRVSERIGGLEI